MPAPAPSLTVLRLFTAQFAPVCSAAQVILRLVVLVLDRGLHRYLLGSLEPVWGLVGLGAISSTRRRARVVYLGEAQPGLPSTNHEKSGHPKMRHRAGSLLQS